MLAQATRQLQEAIGHLGRAVRAAPPTQRTRRSSPTAAWSTSTGSPWLRCSRSTTCARSPRAASSTGAARASARRSATSPSGSSTRSSRRAEPAGTVASVAHPGDDIDIVIADDHTMVRRGLRMVLDSEEGLTVVAEAGDIDAALRATRKLNPRVVVLDLNMPGEPSAAGDPALPRSRSRSRCRRAHHADRSGLRPPRARRRREWLRPQGGSGRSSSSTRCGQSRAVRRYLDPGLGGRLAHRRRGPSSRSAPCSPAIASTGSRAGAAWASSTSRTDLTLDRRWRSS